jgi:Tfp pilus assembly protein PilO
MQDQLDALKKEVAELKEALKHKAADSTLAFYFEPLKRDLAGLEKRVDNVIDATIKAIITNSVEGLKGLKQR